MKKLARFLRYTTIHSLLAWGMYAGWIEHIEGARNCAAVYIWFGFFISWFAYVDAVRSPLARKGRPVPAWLDVWLDIAAVSFLAWHGSFFLAAAYLIMAFNMATIFATPEKDRVPA